MTCGAKSAPALAGLRSACAALIAPADLVPVVVVEIGRVLVLVFQAIVAVPVGVLAEHRWLMDVVVMAVVVAVCVLVFGG